jgi:chromosomal replication initiator protein
MDAWPRCLERLQAEFPAEDVHTWLKPLQADLREDGLVLYAPNAFVMEEVRGRYLGRIRELLAHFAGTGTVSLEIGASRKPVASIAAPSPTASIGEPFHGNLDPHFTFETFVEGRSNQFGRAAAWQAAQTPGDRAHNPLLLYGGTGLGKTHLMFAAGNEMRRQNPAVRVMYLRSEQFMNAFTKALYDKSSGGMEAFKRQFQGIDALLIDDIQFFAGKDRTQEEFFHTFNALFDGKQQIVLTCDRYPKEVDNLEPRLKSRLGWGLSVAIDPPDFETRAAILLNKAASRGVEIPAAVAELIARRMRSNVRDLEGALNTLVARANFLGQPITPDFAQETLRDLLTVHSQAITISNIQKTVADYYQLRLSDLLSMNRSRSLARPRQMAMALAKELTEHSLPEIGDAFGGRDHTTVLHACRVIRELMGTDGKLHEDWDKLVRKLTE